MKNATVLLLSLAVLFLVVSCNGSPKETPTPALDSQPGGSATPKGSTSPNSTVQPEESPPAKNTATPTPKGTEGSPSSTESSWVQDRIDAVASFYHVTPEGLEVLRSLDVRQMVGQPGFFGSFGFYSWTGIGEAKPIQVIHELSHSYWGAFPIAGLPELSWRTPSSGGLSPAMERYHQDFLAFMAQPPDDYEPLRERLRVLPELSLTNTDPLFHTVEADLIFTVGGDLDLVPPILKKYWLNFLGPGPFNSWREALAWYQTLEQSDRTTANRYLGFEHFDLRPYGALEPDRKGSLEESLVELIRREERQRLVDFVGQFDLLLEPSEDKEDFRFWRGYLGDKLRLHASYPEVILSLDLSRANEIGNSLDLLAGLEGMAAPEKAQLVKDQIGGDPLLAFFIPVLDNATLLALFQTGVEIPSETTLGGLAEFVERLKEFTPIVARIIEKGRDNPGDGARELARHLDTMDFKEQKQDMELFFGLLQEGDGQVTASVVSALDDDLLRRLLVPIPATLRFILEPPRLLAALGITTTAPPEQISQGITHMVVNTAGNFRIDEPFDDEMYRLVAERGASAPAQTLGVIAEATFPMERFILNHPEDASRILGADLAMTTRLVRESDRVTFPPARFVYRLISADATLAARVVQRLEDKGHRDLVVEALAYFAYDARRRDQFPALPISLEADGRFLAHLLELRGSEWLESRIGEVVSLYEERMARGDAPLDFLEAYRRTLDAAVETFEDLKIRRGLAGVVESAFGGA